MAKRRRRGPTMIQRSRSVSPAEKAYFHQVSGAGKSRTKRPFFGLSDKEETQVAALLDRRIGVNLRAEG